MDIRRGHGRPPLYEQVKAVLLDELGRGTYPAGSKFVTEREVCDRFGVSTTTAVRALNDLVARRILVRRQGSGTFVAETTGEPEAEDTATPDGGPPSASSPPRTVACVLQGYGGPHITAILRGLQVALQASGYRLYLVDTQDSNEREATALNEAIEAGVAGIVLYPVEDSDNGALIEQARNRDVAVVLVDRYLPEVPTDVVVADNVAVGYEVTKRLIELGHERIATVWVETGCTSVRDRHTGHLQALREHGVPLRPELTTLRRHGDDTAHHPSRIRTLLEAAEPPTVLLCGNAYTLAPALDELLALGLDVPGTVDLATLDDAGPHEILLLTAAAARLPSEQMGTEAARILVDRIERTGQGEMEHVVLPIEIRTRQSAPGRLQVIPAD